MTLWTFLACWMALYQWGMRARERKRYKRELARVKNPTPGVE